METYEKTHPWLTFHLDLNRIPADLWLLLGEAKSKCEHIAGVPLRPVTAQTLHRLYLAKGVKATTAIEGNTLTEREVQQVLDGELELPKSKAYLVQEVKNIRDSCNEIWLRMHDDPAQKLTPAHIKNMNATVLKGLELPKEVVPGQVRNHSVGVGRYRGAPANECEFLLERLCDWLNDKNFDANPDQKLTYAIIKAILAHLYLAWIHPFGDGNGRTARLAEFQILIAAGVPTPAAHLLSDHYNQTRVEYYRQLDMASKTKGNVIPIISYAVQGFVDGLHEQLSLIRDDQWDIVWRNYIFEKFREKTGLSNKRQRELVLDLSRQTDPVPTSKLHLISPQVAQAYAKKSHKTLLRDVDALIQMNLIQKTENGVVANREIILAFLPQKAKTQPSP